MTRGERAVAFVLGIIICSLLSCGLCLMVRENDVILSGGQTVIAHMSEESSPLQNQTSRTAATYGSKLWAYNRALREAAQKNNSIQEALNHIISERVHVTEVLNRSSRLWQSLQQQLGFRTREFVPNKGFGDTFRKWLTKLYYAFPLVRQVTWSGLIGPNQGNADERSSAEMHVAPNFKTHSEMKPYREVYASRFQASDGFPSKKQVVVGDWMVAVLGGIMGIVACALIATGAFRLATVQRDEGAVRRTIFEGQQTDEDDIARGAGDRSDEIVPEEAV